MSIDVAIVMGSASDWDVMSNAQKMLDQFGVKAESRVLSAHRTPKELEEFIRECEEQKVKAFIAGAIISVTIFVLFRLVLGLSLAIGPLGF